MNLNRSSIIPLALVNLALMLGVAYACEIAKEAVRARNSQGLASADIFFWTQVLLTMVTASVLLWGVRWIFRANTIPIWLAAVYLVVGLYIVLTPILFYKSLPMIRWFTLYPPVLGFDSLFYMVGAVVAVLGLFRLIRPRDPIENRA